MMTNHDLIHVDTINRGEKVTSVLLQEQLFKVLKVAVKTTSSTG